jgi:hypothetical protein
MTVNFADGDLHVHWERNAQAEQWIGMSVKLAKACSIMTEESKVVLHEAYVNCLHSLRGS